MSVRYAVITPARDEESHIEQTLQSVVSQSVLPTVWIVVDDGSSDSTADIVRRFADQHRFIRLLQPQHAAEPVVGDRLSRAAEVVAFNAGLATLDLAEYDFIVKLDADLRFGPDYFERLFEKFAEEPRLGIAGGHLFEEHGDQLVLDSGPDWHVRGATKVYRRECFEQIGGLVTLLGWDSFDETRAYLDGWLSRSFLEPNAVHLRPQGASGGGMHHGRWRLGRASYMSLYHPVWVIVRSARIGAQWPWVTGGIAYLAGYLASFVQRPPRLQDAEVAAYIRRSQMLRIMGRQPYGHDGS